MLVKKTTQEHYETYAAMVELIGARSIAPWVPADKETLVECYKKDPHLNNIALRKWDRTPNEQDLYSSPLYIAFRRRVPKGMGLSICDCVCTLKHYAIYHVIEATPQFDTVENIMEESRRKKS